MGHSTRTLGEFVALLKGFGIAQLVDVRHFPRSRRNPQFNREALEADLPAVYGNAGKLQQVFLNLFLNARDAMPGGGRLEVRTWSDGAIARVEVGDTGQGIAPEHLRRIYDPFFTTKAARKGTGLGLSVSYGIIQEHGGAIEVENRRAGGALFRLELPLAAARARKPVNAA